MELNFYNRPNYCYWFLLDPFSNITFVVIECSSWYFMLVSIGNFCSLTFSHFSNFESIL